MSPATNRNDEEIIERVALLYQRYSAVLLARLMRKLPTQQDAADLCQEIYVCLLKAKNLHEVRDWQAYLYSMANHAISRFYSKRDACAPIDDSLAAFSEMSEVASEEEERDLSLQLVAADVRALLDAMNPVHRAVALRCIFLGETTAEAARELALPTRTVERYRAWVMVELNEALNRGKL